MINVSNNQLADKVMQLLSHFKDDGLEVVSKEDLADLKALAATRNEQSIAFEDYLAHANSCS